MSGYYFKIMKSFVHLHNHSEYSLLDGAIPVRRLVELALERNMPAVAITDHGAMFGAIEFYEYAIEKGVKPIIGQECYIAPESMTTKHQTQTGPSGGYHLTILAKDYEGYQNLMKISTAGYLEGFYYKPRIDKEFLRRHAKGLIALSGCLKGEIPSLLLANAYEKAKRVLWEYVDIFGKENFFIEVQNHGTEEEKQILHQLIRLSHETGIKAVATNDCHYPEKKDAEAHDILLCIQTGKTVEDRERLRFPTSEFYFKSAEEMYSLFPQNPELLENSLAVAEECNLVIDFSSFHLPHFPLPQGYSDIRDYIRQKVYEGLQRRYKTITAEQKKRVEDELEIIERMGFYGYFAIVADFINYAKRENIPVGPGRGSATGSLVSYSLGITEIDPLKYNLLFERFLTSGRVTLPDIDIDFADYGREKIINYVKDKYGQNSVSQIITFGRMAARAVVKDVGRAFGMPFSYTDRITKLIPAELNITIERALQESGELEKLAKEDYMVEKILKFGMLLEGLPRHASVHAAGVVITPGELVNFTPLYKTNQDEITTQYDKDSVEKIGLLKMDFLGLRTLTIVQDTIERVKDENKDKLQLANLDITDKKTFELMSRGDTVGVFQFESEGMKKYLRKLKPDKLDDLIAMNALYRPGPIKMIDEYIYRKHSNEKLKYPFPEIENILKETYGIIVYQEQVMLIAQAIAGFTLQEADELRRAMGKKKPEIMAKMREKFIEGARKKHKDEKKAEELFDLMEEFSKYGFNKSHSAAYALLAYQTAYLKAHYPLEFLAANLTAEAGSPSKIAELLDECKRKGIKVLPPDINYSSERFDVEGDCIRFGLGAIKNLGSSAISAILEARKRVGKFENFYQFCGAVDTRRVNKKAIESLIKAGALDSLGGRSELIAALEDVLEATSRKKQIEGPSLFGKDESISLYKPLPKVEPLPKLTLLAMEKDVLGVYLSGHPLAKYEDELKAFTNCTLDGLSKIKSGSNVKVGGILNDVKKKTTNKNEEMTWGTLTDMTSVNVEVVFFPSTYKKVKNFIENDALIWVSGKLSAEETNKPKIIVEEAYPLEFVRNKMIKKLHIRINVDEISDNEIKEIKECLLRHKGNIPLFLHIVTEQKTLQASSYEYASDGSPELVESLRSILGETEVWIS